MSQLDRNTATLNELLELAQNLPEAGTALPELSNPGTADDMLSGKELIDADGNIVVGTIPTVNASAIVMGSATNEGKVIATYTHLAGYKASRETVTKTVQLQTQAGKTITPTKSRQKAVSSRKWTTGDVYVAAIPSNYADVSGLVIEPQDVVAGIEFIDGDGNRNTGTMPNIGSVTASLDLMSGVETYTVPKGYHDGTGTVGIGEDLKDALITINGNTATNVAGAVNNVDTAVSDQATLISQIQTALEGKAAGGGGSASRTPAMVTIKNANRMYDHVVYSTYNPSTGVCVPHQASVYQLDEIQIEACVGDILWVMVTDSDARDTIFDGCTEVEYVYPSDDYAFRGIMGVLIQQANATMEN